MIKIKYWSMIAMSALMSACSSDDFGGGDSTGRIRLHLEVDTEPIGSRSSRAEIGELTADSLKIRLKAAAESKTYEFKSIAELDSFKFPAGAYTLEAYYGDEKQQGFEKPYVHGSTEITVKHKETTPASLEAKLSNAMVSVTYSESVKKYLSNCKVSVNEFEYPENEIRPVYITPGEVNLSLVYTKNLVDIVGSLPSFEAKAQHHHIVNVDLNGGEVGDAVLTITYDDSMEEHEEQIALEGLTAPAEPVLSVAGFTNDEPVSVVASVAREGDLYCGAIARGGFKSLVLKTEGISLDAAWPAEMDLTKVSAENQAKLKNLGLTVRGLWGNGSGETTDMAVVDFSGVVAALPQATSGQIKFTLSGVDKFDQECAVPAVLTLDVTPFRMELSDVPSEVREGNDAFDMKLAYNGGDPARNLKVMSKNDRGTYDEVPATFTGENGVYTISLNPAEPWGRDITLQVVDKNDNKKMTEIATPIEYVKFPKVSVDEVNVWATKAYVTIRDNIDGQYYTPATLTYSTDGTNFTQTMKPAGDNKMMLLENLTPGTKYTIVVANPLYPDIADRRLKEITFTTEAAAQLPNAGMEEWSRENGKTKYWWIEYPGADKGTTPWSTMNLLTTSEGGDQTNWFKRNGCAYCAFSGTRQTTDAHGGNSAAIISTVGWGGSNSAAPSSGFGNCHNVTAGELFLGQWNGVNQDNTYGTSFGSRPASIEFWYKYNPVNNSDYGIAEIIVLSSDKTILASQKVNLTKQASYVKETLDLSYANVAKKVASICVTFKSTGHPDALQANPTWMTPPPARNTSDGRYTGAELYIDDITLNY